MTDFAKKFLVCFITALVAWILLSILHGCAEAPAPFVDHETESVLWVDTDTDTTEKSTEIILETIPSGTDTGTKGVPDTDTDTEKTSDSGSVTIATDVDTDTDTDADTDADTDTWGSEERCWTSTWGCVHSIASILACEDDGGFAISTPECTCCMAPPFCPDDPNGSRQIWWPCEHSDELHSPYDGTNKYEDL